MWIFEMFAAALDDGLERLDYYYYRIGSNEYLQDAGSVTEVAGRTTDREGPSEQRRFF